jgi:hypothetical protein
LLGEVGYSFDSREGMEREKLRLSGNLVAPALIGGKDRRRIPDD